MDMSRTILVTEQLKRKKSGNDSSYFTSCDSYFRNTMQNSMLELINLESSGSIPERMPVKETLPHLKKEAVLH